MDNFKQLALIGPTASGKSALAVQLAHKISANILSLDSLAIYQEIDIASAKPTLEERQNIKHFGIDIIKPNETFDVTTFIDLYKEAKTLSIKEQKSLIIVGGTSFYLNMLLNGISQLPKISQKTKEESKILLQNLHKAYQLLYDLDPQYISNIKENDSYRIEKMLQLYLETGLTPSLYFKQNPPLKTIKKQLNIYEIEVERATLKERIKKRTTEMIKKGLIEEVFQLEKKYGRVPNAMKSIGIKEVLSFLDGHYSKEEMKEKIIIHTAQLAKRQRTFNKSQFQNKTLLPLNQLKKLLLDN